MTSMRKITPATIMVSVVETRAQGEVRRVVSFRAPSDAMPRTVSYTFRGAVLPPPLDRLDFAVLALLFHAMRQGHDLHVAGPVSRVLLANLEELQVFWTVARPGRYRQVRLTADEEVEPARPAGNKAVLAYSGGMDANFSLLQHLFGHLGRRARSVVAAVLIHGFDLRLSQQAEFAATAQRATNILDSFKIPLTLVETDWRSVACADWEMEHGAGFAACLGQFSGVASAALIASGEDYSSIVMPWGFGPVVNPLLGFGDFDFLLDGCSHSRSEKAALIARYPDIKDSLRVCWENAQPDGGNCGRCEKCLRSKMNFMANRIEPGASLWPPPTLGQIVLINARHTTSLGLLQEILRTAKRNEVRAPWVAALRVAMVLSRFRIAVRHVGRPVKAALRGLVRPTRARGRSSV